MPGVGALAMAGVVAGVVALSGCAANYTPRVSVDEIPTMDHAYLYGRFYVDTPKAFLGPNAHMTLGFALQCNDGASYAVRFDRDQPVLAIKVKAATCSWVETIYSEVDGSLKSRKPAPPEAFKDVAFKGGYSYYLGDFYMTVQTTFKEGKATTEWRLKAMRENYENTTDDLLEAYPKLRALPSENHMMWRKDAPKAIPKPIGVGGSIAWVDEAGLLVY